MGARFEAFHGTPLQLADAGYRIGRAVRSARLMRIGVQANILPIKTAKLASRKWSHLFQ